MFWFSIGRCITLFQLVYFLTSLLIGIDYGWFVYGKGIWKFVVICSIFVWKFGISIMWFL